MEQYLTIESDTYHEMIKAIASRKPETGGILGGNGHTINRFHFDALAISDENSYIPDVETLNGIIQTWQNEGSRFLGIIHSHDQQPHLLSTDDLTFARSILQANIGTLSNVFFLLVICPFISHKESLLSYVVTPKKCCSIPSVIQ